MTWGASTRRGQQLGAVMKNTEPPTLTELGVQDVVDAHHHIWRMADLPWLQGPMVPRIFGPYEAVRRDYLVDEYVRDVTAEGGEAAVYVQPNWALDRAVDEVRWVQGVHDATGWPDV